MKKSAVTRGMQRAVSDVLNRILSCTDIDDIAVVVQQACEDYMLEHDPFTGLLCSRYDYVQSCLKYDKQTMIDKFGHCDGLE